MKINNMLESFRFNIGDSTSLYAQLAEFIRQKIKSGALKPGDMMIPENDIAEEMKISRTTVRLAYEQLVDEGLIVRYRGKGSFVAEKQLQRNINYLYSFTDNIRASGAVPSSTVHSCEVRFADDGERKALGLDSEDAEVFVLERMRMANGTPMIVEKTLIPHYLCPGIEKIDFSVASLYTVLRNSYGINIERAEETIEAVILNKTITEQLGCHQGRPGYLIKRTSYMKNGFTCEVTSSYTCADRCIFKLELTENSKNKEKTIDFERKMLLD